MNEDICKREVLKAVPKWITKDMRYTAEINTQCNKPKNPEHLYCPDCEREVFDEKLNSLS